MDDALLADLDEAARSQPSTPARLFLPRTADRVVRRAAELRELSTDTVEVTLAYSVKTNPDQRVMRLMARHGLLPEVISQAELISAVDCGFEAKAAVLNSAGKWWPAPILNRPALACFEESHEELEQTLGGDGAGPLARFVGPRIRGSASPSRLGVVFDRDEDLRRLGSALRRLPGDHGVGVHVHTAAGLIGYRRWWSVIADVLITAGAAVSTAAGRAVELLDLGGGWPADDFVPQMRRHLPSWIGTASRTLPALRQVVLEPGKAVAQETMALMVSVLAIRRRDGHREVVVDGSIAELPGASQYPHRLLAPAGAGEWQRVGRGRDRVIGRLPSDTDTLAAFVSLPSSLSVGDSLVLLDAGAYDTSLAYLYGSGRTAGV